MIMFKKITTAFFILFLFSACQNSSPVNLLPDPPGGGFPGGSLPGDAGSGTAGTGVSYGELNDCVNPFYGSLTPFRNPLTNPFISADSSGLGDFPGLTGMTNAYLPEIGDVILVSTADGVLVFDSIGRPIARPLTFDDDCFYQSGNFLWPPENDGTYLDIANDPYGSLGGSGYFAASVYGGLGTYRLTSRQAIGGDPADDYWLQCDIEEGDAGPIGPADFWDIGNELVEFSGDTLYDGQGSPFQVNSLPGGPGQLGVEWDAYGNLWQRTVGLPVWPNFQEIECQSPIDDNPDTRGENPVALLIGWTRGEGVENQTGYNPGGLSTCPYESNAGDGFESNPGDCRMHVFIDPVNPMAPAAWGIPTNFNIGGVIDFDFTSDNRMVFTAQLQPGKGVCISQQIPDLLDAHQSSPYFPPQAPQIQKCVGGWGSNTAGENTHFLNPWGISIDKHDNLDEIYVSDYGNARVVVLDSDLNFLRSINETHSPLANIQGPMDVDFDFFCRIFVLDQRVGGDPELLVLFRDNCPVPGNGSAEVTVRDAETGVPIESASIVLGMFSGTVSGITDTEGRLSFPTIPPGIRSITVSASGYHSSAVQFTVTSGETTIIEDSFGSGSVGVNLTKIGDATTGNISGMVRDSVTGLPIDGAFVLVRNTGQIDVTDGTGLFRIDEILPGAKQVDISANGYMGTTRTIIVEAGRTIDMGSILLDPQPSS